VLLSLGGWQGIYFSKWLEFKIVGMVDWIIINVGAIDEKIHPVQLYEKSIGLEDLHIVVQDNLLAAG